MKRAIAAAAALAVVVGLTASPASAEKPTKVDVGGVVSGKIHTGH